GWSTIGLLLVLPAIGFVVHNLFDAEKMVFGFMDPESKVNFAPLCLLLGMAPGVSEEIVFRGIPCSNWMRVAKDEGAVMKCALFTALVFGLVHGLNALSGAPIFATIFQVTYAFAIGLFFAAVFLRTGSMWPTMIAHTLIDFAAFLFMDIDAGGIITEELKINLDFYITVGLAVFVLLWGLFLLRRSKREQILQLWDRKWHKSKYINQGGYTY
ncbi:MAG: CPBP family intramembrane metalloprotease, partial [Atopobiaceae bacterium]|nr:CPBP family intramembrane metalloprotease [Atopobiaceae bacterium]